MSDDIVRRAYPPYRRNNGGNGHPQSHPTVILNNVLNDVRSELGSLPDSEWQVLYDILKVLSPRHIEFVMEYMVDMNATQAALRCDYGPAGAHVTGTLILNSPNVRAAVDKLLELRARNSAMIANRLLIGLDDLAHLDKSEIYDPDTGCIRPMHEWPPAARQALTGIKVKELWSGEGDDRRQVGQVVSIQMVDPLRAREMLMKHRGMLQDHAPGPTTINNTNIQINQQIMVDKSDFSIEELEVISSAGLKLVGREE